MLFWLILRRGLWRSFDREKFRLFFGWTAPLMLSRRLRPWLRIPWARAVFSRRGAEEIYAWLEYRIRLYDGDTG